MKLSAYVRVSTEDQVRGYSLEAQENAIKTWAAEHGYELVKVFVEPGLSAKTDNRPIFQSMIKTVERGEADGVVIHKSDRIARNLLDLLIYRNRLEQSGKRIFSVVEPFFNSDSPENRMVTGIIGSVNEFYSANLGREVQKGQTQKAKNGIYPGGRIPLGYMRDDEKNMVIDPDHGPFIAYAFTEFSTGRYDLRSWATAAKKMGFTNRLGEPLLHQSWGKIFRNKFYIGFFKWGGETYQGDYPTLVSFPIFNAVQDILTANNSGGSKIRHFWLLSSLLYSLKYHVRMSGSLTNKGHYAYYRARGDGPEHGVNASKLESEVINLLETIRYQNAKVKEAWLLAMRCASSMADIWPNLSSPEEQKEFLRLIFRPNGIRVNPNGTIAEIKLHKGFAIVTNQIVAAAG